MGDVCVLCSKDRIMYRVERHRERVACGNTKPHNSRGNRQRRRCHRAERSPDPLQSDDGPVRFKLPEPTHKLDRGADHFGFPVKGEDIGKAKAYGWRSPVLCVPPDPDQIGAKRRAARSSACGGASRALQTERPSMGSAKDKVAGRPMNSLVRPSRPQAMQPTITRSAPSGARGKGRCPASQGKAKGRS